VQDHLLDVRLPLMSKFGRFGLVAVAGESMEPTFLNGDWLLVIWGAGLKATNAVVIEREDRPGVFLVKRILRIENGKYWVEGDNKNQSTDSRIWGTLDEKEVVARVILRVRKGR
jgi:phage repressor protein C with HTH and peptisase S24 domain